MANNKPNAKSTTVTTKDGWGSIAGDNAKRSATKNALNPFNLRGGIDFDEQQLTSMYDSSGFAKKVIDAPVDDALRNGRTWNVDEENRLKIEALEIKLDWANTMMECYSNARLYGGCTVLIITADKDYSLPLDYENLPEGGLLGLSVIPRKQYQSVEIEPRIGEPNYGKPIMFNLAAVSTLSKEQVIKGVHPSRLVVMRGEKRLFPRGHISTDHFWGFSVLRSRAMGILNLESGFANMSALGQVARTGVLKAGDILTKSAEDGGKTKAARVVQAFTDSQSNTGVSVINSDMDFTLHNVDISKFPPALQEFAVRVAAEADIPVTRLFARSPAGLNSTGEGDSRNYYDRLRGDQVLRIQPPMRILDRVIARSALGDAGADAAYKWNPLRTQSAEEKSRAAMNDAKVILELFRSGLITEEIGKAQAEVLLGAAGIGEQS